MRRFLSRANASALGRIAPLVLLAAAAWAAGCATASPAENFQGGGSDGGGSSSTSSGDAAAPVMAAPSALGIGVFGMTCNSGPSVDYSPVRRISRVEYNNMVRDLLGDRTHPADPFVSESPLEFGVNFVANTYTSVSSLVVQQYVSTAETLAQNAVSNPATLPGLLGCSTQDQPCAQQFIGSFANRAFRGQLDGTVSASLLQLFSDVASQTDFATGIQAVITAVLESPRFLYVLEFGAGSPSGSAVLLSPYEVAGRLAFFLWRSVPDAALMQLAADGQLATADQVRAQAQAMLADPKAQDAIDDFTTQWLQLQLTSSLDKDSQFTKWNSLGKIGEELFDETLTNYAQAVLADNASLGDVLTSPTSYINGDLASFYLDGGVGNGKSVTVSDPALPQGQSTFVKTPIPFRAGILTNGGVLASQSHTTLPSAVLRGKLVREQVLCNVIPPPPPNIPPAPTSPPDGGTFRQQFEAAHDLPGCISCHKFMDPLGWAFGNFDATGAYQATDSNGFSGTFPPIDTSGAINGMNPGDLGYGIDGGVPISGSSDLTSALAGSTQVQECFALQQFRYALSRIETAHDACSAQQIETAFTGGNLNIQKLMVAIVGTDAFRYRSVVTPGATCQ
jgi:Protein of unknown function (DUF1592)/Protein of unknown function (DUF1588)/Protein of unknown function (DUF1595)/Protein of unknown function (DUF1585)/Protein of unknown function (DUF1587)